jgi:hypothetical protein
MLRPKNRFRDWGRFRNLALAEKLDCGRLQPYPTRDEAEAAGGEAARIFACPEHGFHQLTFFSQCINKATGKDKVAYLTYDAAWEVVLAMNDPWAAPYRCRAHGWHIGRRRG